MTKEMMSVDALLEEQSRQRLRATIESVEGDPKLVKVTPWIVGAGCLCHLELKLPKASIKGVAPTGEIHHCCGKSVQVVEVNFNPGQGIELNELFSQLSTSVKTPASFPSAAPANMGPSSFIPTPVFMAAGEPHMAGTPPLSFQPATLAPFAFGLPGECTKPGASRSYTNTHCIMPVQWCQNCCRVPDPRDPAKGREVCGIWHPCGVCFGLPW